MSSYQQNLEETLEAVLQLARLGWPVLPLQPAEKKPAGQLVPAGLKQATLDPEQIRSWAQRTPTANWGIAPPDSVMVLDIDAPKTPADPDPNQLLESILLRWSIQPQQLVATPSGGWHCYLKLDPNWGQQMPARARIYPGLDLRGLGRSYLVALY